MTRQPHQTCGLTILVCVVAACTTAACSQVGKAAKYFLTPCAGDGPERSTDFDVRIPPFDLDAHYAFMRGLRAPVIARELDTVSYDDRSYPILRADRAGANARGTLLVIVGIHGNEVAGTLAVEQILAEAQETPWPYEHWNLTVLTPANPVGHAHGSRYNGEGCDINRDFRRFRTREAQIIRELYVQTHPAAVIALHEGPQDGFFVIVTAAGSERIGARIAKAVGAAGGKLADRNFLGIGLGTPGYDVEGFAMTNLKRLIQLHSLGAYGVEQGVGTYTVETNWSEPDFDARVRAQRLAVETVLAATDLRE